jgi:hypothetical protein
MRVMGSWGHLTDHDGDEAWCMHDGWDPITYFLAAGLIRFLFLVGIY